MHFTHIRRRIQNIKPSVENLGFEEEHNDDDDMIISH